MWTSRVAWRLALADRQSTSHGINAFAEATMAKLLARWERLCASSRVLWFMDINLRGVGQVMFQNNPLSGKFQIVQLETKSST